MVMVDIMEPDEAYLLLAQVIDTASLQRFPLNQRGYADYLIIDPAGARRQFEREQVGAILADMDAIEAELRRHLVYADDTTLLVEGVVAPHPAGCVTYIQSSDARFFRIGRIYKTNYAKYRGWLFSLDCQGVRIMEAATLDASMSAIAEVYRNLQKPEHRTLSRYIRPKVTISEYNPHILALMSMAKAVGAGIGEVGAKALIARYTTLWNTLCQTEEELCQVKGVDDTSISRLFHGIGRG